MDGVQNERDAILNGLIITAVNETQAEAHGGFCDLAVSENEHAGITIGDSVGVGQSIVGMLD